MAKGELRNPPEEDGKIDPNDYGLTGQLARLVDAAMHDPDPVSMLALGPSPERAHVAIVVLKSRDVVVFFEAWAQRNKIFHNHDNGMNAALERAPDLVPGTITRELALEAGHYIRDAAAFEPEEDPDAPPVGHDLADRIFTELGVDISGPEHAHTRCVDDEEDLDDG